MIQLKKNPALSWQGNKTKRMLLLIPRQIKKPPGEWLLADRLKIFFLLHGSLHGVGAGGLPTGLLLHFEYL